MLMGHPCKSGSWSRVVLGTPDGLEIKYSLMLRFLATNNVAKYEALIVGLKLARECSVRVLIVHSDSEFMVYQILGVFGASNP
ncbi:hypothetical protein Nepgr_021130 [Nepenthes gracilis]|uniref:RNase H type-1 domain-containing protein n=1 Tax=Nepenthes gracilis TaxID=150966 RepID=A0AAD3XWS0_NEPGR|nr:hypothetical protein Nepgr_021130 [Nepenthes gracilis]